MHKVIHSDKVKIALQDRGWSQKKLATELAVTPQSVTNWLKGDDFPRPEKLLKLATTLKLSFSDLVRLPDQVQPVIAFRKKGAAITTDAHINKAMAMGALLRLIVEHLTEMRALRVQLPSPTTQYEALQAIATEIRNHIGLGTQAVLSYEHLIKEFNMNGAVIVPVMWGEVQNHKNALHILLPQEKVTFIFLNLDTRLEDFKFWMAHELAHVYTPELAGQDVGEDFADALAGALLFPRAVAEHAYGKAAAHQLAQSQIKELLQFAKEHSISLFSVFCEVQRYAEALSLPPLKCQEQDIHAVRNYIRGKLVSESLFNPAPPEPAAYIAAAQNIFDSEFFVALQKMIKSRGVGPSYLQQAMDIPMKDAILLHGELSR